MTTAMEDSKTAMVDPLSKAPLTKASHTPTVYERLQTTLRSFLILKNLTKEQVDSFMDSYIIYDLDWADEKRMIEVLGPNYQQRVGQCLADYYAVLNHLCAIGELEKMYVPPILDPNQGIIANQILYEELVAQELQLPAGAKVLDIGCGRGRVAAHMTEMTDAKVSGLNIDKDQLASAVAFNEVLGYSNNFVRRDMNDLPLPFEDQEFDGFYQIQAFSLCKDIPKMCSEIYRVLKPGARVSMLDWASLDAYNPEDAHHQELMKGIKPIIGAVGTPTPQSMADALEGAGFRIIRHYQPSHEGIQAPLLERAKLYFYTARWAMMTAVRFWLLPAHFETLFNRMTKHSDDFIEADRSKLITTCYHWVAEKPKDNESPAKTGSPASSASEVHASSASSDGGDKQIETPATPAEPVGDDDVSKKAHSQLLDEALKNSAPVSQARIVPP
jgi:sterol 24-C-methyltransferase